MTDDVGTSCATTNATPETSFAPRQGMNAPMAWTGNRPLAARWGTRPAEHVPNAPVHSR
ncbi:hypothetical protein GCM10020221_27500 [Streptomyces thioluteus]|uniref:Uncharacterized protein n=1 Tax=Streptomyces thioluteus TaxID=66431 RepID=A0ABN3WW79_STRTU